jgi:hypothetical protein
VTTPNLRVVSGSPTPEELAVLAALVATAPALAEPAPSRPSRGGWADHLRSHRRELVPGPNAWRSSGW